MLLNIYLHFERCNYFFNKIEYFKALLCFLVIGGIVILLFLIAYYIAPQHNDSEKISAYECGFAPFYDARINLIIHYYMISLLFILFDIELLFLIPWVLSISSLHLIGYISFLFFLILLIGGLWLEWQSNALDWRRI